MFVAVAYQFHDREIQLAILDTNLLDADNLFQAKLKKLLESKKKYLTIDGNAFEGCHLPAAAKANPPRLVDSVKYVRIDFEG